MISMPREPVTSRSSSFRGERLQLVREFRAYTQKEMSTIVATSSAAISDFENGKRIPSDSLIERIAFESGFLTDFFYRRLEDPFLDAECSFRHRRAAAQRTKDQVRAHAALVSIVVDRLRGIFHFPEATIPSIQADIRADIERAAEGCRSAWQLDTNAPIRHVGRVLEHAGIVVIAGSVDVTKIDAFSRLGRNPLVFLNRARGTYPSRWNFDLAHELGHLVLHRELLTGSVETEMAADSFASAFLMPARSFGTEFRSRDFSWSLVFELKRRWQVSAAAIVRRGRDLGLISEVTYRRAFQYMSAKRWRVVGEPYEPDFQEPELFLEGLKAVRESQAGDLSTFAEELGFSGAVFRKVTGIPVKTNTSGPVIRFPGDDEHVLARESEPTLFPSQAPPR
jgi:Zn-dependent peptidase ImmA (M78 family)/transcriptional regulator with XRE-family HTH domain